jgi:hypothetical protein
LPLDDYKRFLYCKQYATITLVNARLLKCKLCQVSTPYVITILYFNHYLANSWMLRVDLRSIRSLSWEVQRLRLFRYHTRRERERENRTITKSIYFIRSFYPLNWLWSNRGYLYLSWSCYQGWILCNLCRWLERSKAIRGNGSWLVRSFLCSSFSLTLFFFY